jgi:hypothetical protein
MGTPTALDQEDILPAAGTKSFTSTNQAKGPGFSFYRQLSELIFGFYLFTVYSIWYN